MSNVAKTISTAVQRNGGGSVHRDEPADGRVLFAGGDPGQWNFDGPYLASAELYDPRTGTFRPTGAMGKAATFRPRRTYTYNGDGSDGLAYPTIHAVGGTATGVCDWNHPAGPIQAECVFDTGTGALTWFHLSVRVSSNANGSIWSWDGTYWFGS